MFSQPWGGQGSKHGICHDDQLGSGIEAADVSQGRDQSLGPVHGSSIGQSDDSTSDDAKCSLVRGYQRKEEAEVACWLRNFILGRRLAATSSLREIKDPHGLRGGIPRSCTNAPAGNSKQRHRPIQQRGEIIGGQGSIFIVDDWMGIRGSCINTGIQISESRHMSALCWRNHLPTIAGVGGFARLFVTAFRTRGIDFRIIRGLDWLVPTTVPGCGTVVSET